MTSDFVVGDRVFSTLHETVGRVCDIDGNSVLIAFAGYVAALPSLLLAHVADDRRPTMSGPSRY